MRISQSFLKDYFKGTCGNILKSKYIDNDYPQGISESMNKGKFFEYIATGYIRHGEEPPQAEYYKKSGAGYTAGDIKPEYLILQNHSELFKQTLESYKLKIKSVGETLKYGNFEGITDVICENDVIIDLKASDLLYNKWEEYGWGIERFKIYSDDLLENLKKNHLLWQPLHYSYIYKMSKGVYPTWYFYVVSTKTTDVVFRQIDISYETHKKYAELVKNIEQEIDLILNTGGFDLKRTYNSCSNCLKKCEYEEKVPTIECVKI